MILRFFRPMSQNPHQHGHPVLFSLSVIDKLRKTNSRYKYLSEESNLDIVSLGIIVVPLSLQDQKVSNTSSN